MLSAAANIAASAISAYSAYATNQQNIAAQQRENAITRSREDSAYQRAVRDARAAGLSPLAVVGTSGASAIGQPAPMATRSPASEGVQAFLNSAAVRSQIGLNNAQSSKVAEETKGQSITNAFLGADYQARILKLLHESDNIRVTTEREREFLREYRSRLTAELEGMKLTNTGKGISNSITSEGAAMKKEMGLTPDTSVSSTTGGNLVDAARIETYGAMKANQKEQANAVNHENELKAEYNRRFSRAFNDWKIAKKDYQGKLQRAYDLAKREPTKENISYYKKLKSLAPKRSDFFPTYEEWKKKNKIK